MGQLLVKPVAVGRIQPKFAMGRVVHGLTLLCSQFCCQRDHKTRDGCSRCADTATIQKFVLLEIFASINERNGDSAHRHKKDF